MKLKTRVCVNMTFVNGTAVRVRDFKEKHPKITHNEIYLKGLEIIEKE